MTDQALPDVATQSDGTTLEISGVSPGQLDMNGPSHKILSLPVKVIVSVGSARMQFRDILDLAADKIIDLDSTIDDPVEIFVGEKLIARGELIETSEDTESLGVRITEIINDE